MRDFQTSLAILPNRRNMRLLFRGGAEKFEKRFWRGEIERDVERLVGAKEGRKTALSSLKEEERKKAKSIVMNVLERRRLSIFENRTSVRKDVSLSVILIASGAVVAGILLWNRRNKIETGTEQWHLMAICASILFSEYLLFNAIHTKIKESMKRRRRIREFFKEVNGKIREALH